MEWMTGIKLKFDGLPLLRLLRAFHNCAAYGASAVVVSRTETYSIRLYSSSGKKAALTLYIPLTMFYAVWNTQCLRDLFCSIIRVLIFILNKFFLVLGPSKGPTCMSSLISIFVRFVWHG